jgi:tetratricopeptide (TPR) repeat protein
VSIEQTIFSNDLYKVGFFPAETPSQTLFFTFTERGFRKLDGPGFGTLFLTKLGYDVISVKSLFDHWYQDLPLELIACVCRFFSRRRNIYTKKISYGSSMGAYAAIFFSEVLRVDAVIAISPQFDITSEWDKRWHREAIAIKSSFLVPDASRVYDRCSYTIVYDPADSDRLHFERYAGIIPPGLLNPIRTYYGGHPAGYLLNKTEALRELIESIAGGWPTNLRIRINAGKKIYPNYYFNLAWACHLRKKPKWARSIIGKALAADPLNAEYNIRAAQISEKAGNLTEAVRFASVAVAVNPTHPSMAAALSRFLGKARLWKQALHYIDVALKIEPTSQMLVSQRRDLLEETGLA